MRKNADDPGKRLPRNAVMVSAVILLVFAGCSSRPPIARLSGSVTFEGEPLAEGLLVLSNSEFGVYMTAPIRAGAYEVRTADGGVPPGNYRVAITPPIVDHPIGPISEPPRNVSYADIPQRYRTEETSGFVVELQDGDNVFAFDMEKT